MDTGFQKGNGFGSSRFFYQFTLVLAVHKNSNNFFKNPVGPHLGQHLAIVHLLNI